MNKNIYKILILKIEKIKTKGYQKNIVLKKEMFKLRNQHGVYEFKFCK